MKTKSFYRYLKKILSKEEIETIEKKAEEEINMMKKQYKVRTLEEIHEFLNDMPSRNVKGSNNGFVELMEILHQMADDLYSENVDNSDELTEEPKELKIRHTHNYSHEFCDHGNRPCNVVRICCPDKPKENA